MILILWSLGLIGVALLWHVMRTTPPAPHRLFCPWGLEDVLMVAGMLVVVVVMLGLGADVVFPVERMDWNWAAVMGVMVLGPGAGVVFPPETMNWLPAAVMGVAGALVGTLLLFYLHRRYGLWPQDVGLRLDGWKRDLALAAGLLVLVMAVRVPVVVVLQYLRERAGRPREFQLIVSQMLDVKSNFGLVVMVVVALFIAPVWEELFFRGFIQPFLGRYLGPGASIGVTAAVFAAIHDPRSTLLTVPLMVFPLALALGYAYHRTQRLAAPIMLHVLHNVVTVLAVLVTRASGHVPPA